MNNNVRLALIFTLAIVIWFASGTVINSEQPQSVVASGDRFTKVQVIESQQQVFSPAVSLRAQTKANRAVNLLAQVSGRISATLVEEGSRVQAGQGICQIDAEDRYLRVAQAQASLENAEIAYRGALRLKAGGYQSELAIAQAKAALASARTYVKRAQLDVENLQIKAPFDGILEARPLEVGDFVTPGRLCATLVELNTLKIEALATETEITSLAVGNQAKVVVGGKPIPGAVVSYLAHQANPMTKGYRVEATMENPGQKLRAGVSAQLNVQIASVKGHLIPASTILLNDMGETIVRVLDTSQTVVSFKVVAVGESSTGIWVTGLPETVVLVTVGQNYIIDGERVEPAFSANRATQ